MTDHWTEHAACLDADWRLFFPAPRPGRIGREQYAGARAYCNRCEVRAECLAFAMQSEWPKNRDGMYGGLMPSERDRIKVGRRVA